LAPGVRATAASPDQSGSDSGPAPCQLQDRHTGQHSTTSSVSTYSRRQVCRQLAGSDVLFACCTQQQAPKAPRQSMCQQRHMQDTHNPHRMCRMHASSKQHRESAPDSSWGVKHGWRQHAAVRLAQHQHALRKLQEALGTQRGRVEHRSALHGSTRAHQHTHSSRPQPQSATFSNPAHTNHRPELIYTTSYCKQQYIW
jgi:hypothetical protein